MNERWRRLRCLALVCALGCAARVPAQGQGQPQAAAAILAQYRSASGGEAWVRVAEITSESTIVAGNLLGKLKVRYDLRTGANWDRVELQGRGLVEDHTVAPVIDWARDEAGDVTLSPGSKNPAEVDDLYIHRHGWWEPGFGGARTTVLPEAAVDGRMCDRVQMAVPGGRGFTLWIDQKTHLPAELESRDGTTRYSDYRRTSAGLILPFHEERGTATSPVSYQTTQLETLSTLREEDFAPPFHKDYTFPASGQVTVPAEGGIIVDMKLNGQGPFKTVFDTGGVNGMSRAFANRLGLKVEDKPIRFGAIGGTLTVHTTHVDTVSVGGLTLRDQTFYVLDLPDDLGAPQMIVGWEWMRRFAIRVDPEKNELTLIDGPPFTYPGDGARVPLLLNPHGNGAEIEAEVNGIAGRFTLDTGNQLGTFLNAPFVEEHHLVAATGARYRGYNGKGFGGDAPEAWIGRVKELRIGSLVIADPVVHLQTGTDAMYSNAGNLGQNVLDRFVMVLDAMRSVMYLEKTARWNEHEVWNRAGIIIDPVNGIDHVKTVFPGGTGQAAGLVAGDEVIAVNGKPPADDPNDPAFAQAEGTVVRLRVRRGGVERDISVPLRDVL